MEVDDENFSDHDNIVFEIIPTKKMQNVLKMAERLTENKRIEAGKWKEKTSISWKKNNKANMKVH